MQRDAAKSVFASRIHILLTALFVLTAATGLFAQGPGFTASDGAETSSARLSNLGFRAEKVRVAGGAELMTVFSRQAPPDNGDGPPSEIPLISVLRDTLGDENPENDRLRYVWMLTHTNPSVRQKIAGAVPFLYTRTRNKSKIGDDPPPPIIDMNASDKRMWNNLFWEIFKRIAFDELGIGIRSPMLHYRNNVTQYRKSSMTAAVTALTLYQEATGEKVLSDKEFQDIQAKIFLSDKLLGFHMQPENLGRVYEKETAKVKDYRGHNWELLRQYSEAQGLYFDPIETADGSARHAIVWVSASDIQANRGKKFDRRFLNFKSPWDDERLLNWKGYAEVRWYDAEDREVDSETPGARPRTLIPLAVYGLDYPKVPVILVDFRDSANPKFREISKRVLNDLTGDVLSLSAFSGVPFFVGRYVYDFVTGRRGLDINQSSRYKAYAQLKLLIALDASLDPELRGEIAKRVESSSLNPLENDTDIEIKIAKKQYTNLISWAQRPDGLPKKLNEDRREEMSRLVHGKYDRGWFALGHLVSFGLYTHRETPTRELMAQLDERRQLDHHERFIKEVAFRSADPVIDSDIESLRRSLAFVAQNGEVAGGKTSKALAKIFNTAGARDIRELCLAGLYRVNNSSAKKELLAIYKNQKVEDQWRDASANYLRLALQEGQRISKQDAQLISAIAAN